jgi:plastocyanin
MRSPVLIVLIGAILVAVASGCGGAGPSGLDMPTPTTNTAPSGAATVSIVGQSGAQSFSPNPAPIAQGSLVVWHNMDSSIHHIVMNDGSFDSGDIGPGGTSTTMRLTSGGGNYHCTIHPTTMFGSINVATDSTPPGSSPSPY